MSTRVACPAVWLAMGLLGATVPTPSAAAAAVVPPRPTKYATDRAGVFPPSRLAALNEKLAAFERTTSNQVLVYVDRSLPPGTTLEEMSAAALREWGVGQKGKDNGVILFVFTADRAFRLEVGYGLEGSLPDARARQITSDVVKPYFRKGDYAGGVEAGVDAILAAAGGEGFRGTGRTHAESRAAGPNPPGFAALLALGLAGFFGLILRKNPRRSPRFYIFFLLLAFSLGLFLTALVTGNIPWAVGGGVLFFISLVALIITLVILGLAHATVGQKASASDSSPSASSWDSSSAPASSSFSSDSSSSSSSSSDFSGGGGDSGGGGSSDSW